MTEPKLTASVKVMRSYDYCHFEVTLSSNEIESPLEVDLLRKTAARLADKAVEQYKVAKQNAQNAEYDERERRAISDAIKEIEAKPESELTPKEKAWLKAAQDRVYQRALRLYDYEDDFEEEDFEPWQDPDTEEAVF